LGLRQADLGRFVVARDAPIAGQCDLKPAAEAGTMDGGYFWDFEPREAVKDGLAEPDEVIHPSGRHTADSLQVGSGNEDAIFAAAKDQCSDAGVVLEGFEVVVELSQRFLVPDIGGGFGAVEDKPSDAVVIDIDPEMTRRGIMPVNDVPKGVRSVVQHVRTVGKCRFHGLRWLLQVLTADL
jgi:hypothetical protein